MSEQRYDIVDVVEDIAKVGYSVGVFTLKTFYHVSSIEALKNGMDAFMLERFRQRFEYFTNEHKKLSENEKKDFYDDLKSNKQNLNYLYEFVEKLRTTPFDLNALILARFSIELVKNKSLNYYESTLLANINIFNNTDWEVTYNNLKEIFDNSLYEYSIEEQTSKQSFKINGYEDISTFNKLIQIGIIVDIKEIDGNSFGFGSIDRKIALTENKLFYCNHITKDFYYILKDVIENIK